MWSVVILCCFLSLSPVLLGTEVGSFDTAPRQELNFSIDWVFIPKDLPGAEQPGLDDYSFERVSLPHANIRTPHETFDPDMFRFVSCYRKDFYPYLDSRHRRGLGAVSNVRGEGPAPEQFPRPFERFRRRWSGHPPLSLSGATRFAKPSELARSFRPFRAGASSRRPLSRTMV